MIQSYERAAHGNGTKPSLPWTRRQWSEILSLFILQFRHYLFGPADRRLGVEAAYLHEPCRGDMRVLHVFVLSGRGDIRSSDREAHLVPRIQLEFGRMSTLQHSPWLVLSIGFGIKGAARILGTSRPPNNCSSRLIPSCAQRGKTSIHKIPPAPL